MQRQVIGLMLGVALLGAGYAKAGVVIDNFDTRSSSPHPTLDVNAGTKSDVPMTGQGILGTRNISLTVTSVTQEAKDARADIITSALSLANDSNVASKLLLTWTSFGSVDLNGPDGNGTFGEKPWLIFHAIDLDQALIVDVTLKSSDGSISTNEYVKLPAQGLSVCGTGATFTAPFDKLCPQIVGPIFDVNPAVKGAEGNYFHALDSFVNGGIDPVTGKSFFVGTQAAGGASPNDFSLADLNTVSEIDIAFTAPNSDQDFGITCISSGATNSGNVLPDGAKTNFGTKGGINGDNNLESSQCNVVPEPSSILLLGTGFLGVGLVGIRTRFLRRRQQA